MECCNDRPITPPLQHSNPPFAPSPYATARFALR